MVLISKVLFVLDNLECREVFDYYASRNHARKVERTENVNWSVLNSKQSNKDAWNSKMASSLSLSLSRLAKVLHNFWFYSVIWILWELFEFSECHLISLSVASVNFLFNEECNCSSSYEFGKYMCGLTRADFKSNKHSCYEIRMFALTF